MSMTVDDVRQLFQEQETKMAELNEKTKHQYRDLDEKTKYLYRDLEEAKQRIAELENKGNVCGRP